MGVNQCRLRTSRANCSRKQAMGNYPVSVENRQVSIVMKSSSWAEVSPFLHAREKSLHIRTNRRHFRDSLYFTPESYLFSEFGGWVKGIIPADSEPILVDKMPHIEENLRALLSPPRTCR